MQADPEEIHTVLVDAYLAASNSDVAVINYKGLQIHALPGLHEFTYSVMQQHAQPGETVLDLAAGSGAMSLRLADGGYNVTATDYVQENFRLHGKLPFFSADLNNNFSSGREESFDVLCASEIIEHLENPRHFARQCFKLLRPGGRMILSTPNVDTAASVASFMRDGTFQWFCDANYKNDGHITPLTQWQLGKCFKESGFSFLWKGSFGSRTQVIEGSPRLVLLAKLIDKLMTKEDKLKNQIFVAVLQKPA